MFCAPPATSYTTWPLGPMLFEHGSSLSDFTPSSPSAIAMYLERSVSAAGQALLVPTIVLHSICEAPKPGTRMTGVSPHSSGLVACRPQLPAADCAPKIR